VASVSILAPAGDGAAKSAKKGSGSNGSGHCRGRSEQHCHVGPRTTSARKANAHMARNSAALEDARAAGIAEFLSDVNPRGAKELNAYTAFTNPSSIESIPTGALTLDVALGVGGMPRGRIVELYGPESSGKTSLALSVGAQAIKAGGVMGFVDVENAINFDHVRDMGVDLRYFVLSQPDSGEEALQMMERMAESGKFDYLVLDSVAALIPRAELEGDIGDTHVGLTARLMSQGLRKLTAIAAKHNVTMVFINQIREKIGVMYGNPETTPGGKALKFYASVRMEVRSAAGARIKEGSGVNEVVLGQKCTVTIKKNKVAAPFKKAEYPLYFGRGIDTSATIVDAAVKCGLWDSKAGGTYFDTQTGEAITPRGKDNIIAALAQDSERADATAERIRAVLAARRNGFLSEELSELEPPAVLEQGDLAGALG
jgi:recombination protein RecA